MLQNFFNGNRFSHSGFVNREAVGDFATCFGIRKRGTGTHRRVAASAHVEFKPMRSFGFDFNECLNVGVFGLRDLLVPDARDRKSAAKKHVLKNSGTRTATQVQNHFSGGSEDVDGLFESTGNQTKAELILDASGVASGVVTQRVKKFIALGFTNALGQKLAREVWVGVQYLRNAADDSVDEPGALARHFQQIRDMELNAIE